MPSKQNQPASFPFDQKVVWEPVIKWMDDSNLQKFMTKHDIADYDHLMERSINDASWFWDAVIRDLQIDFYEPYSKVLDTSGGIELPVWCVDGKMNIVHNCLDKWQSTKFRHQAAVRWENEEGTVRILTYEELYHEVNRCANGLRSLGLKKGDSVGLLMPMIPELVIAFLAILKIGGMILPLFSGYGPSAISSRLNDCRAKAIVTADGYYRRGKSIGMKAIADEALLESPSVKHMIVVDYISRKNINWMEERDHWWHELIPRQSDKAVTEKTDAEDAAMLIYTSGTTGKPKGAVHTHCGFPVKAAMDMFYAMDLKPGNVMYWMTDMGWMMGPWEVFGSLIIGATMVFYEGAPDYPEPDRLWSLIESHHITHLGISPALIRTLKTHGPDAVKKHDVTSLRMTGSTGSPWDPDSWLWLFKNVLNSEKPIFNYSGGTEISGGILCGNYFKPLKPCSFSGPVIGMDADVVNENGEAVRGEVGELVIRKPWIGMTRGFWDDRQRYLDTYWSRFGNMWLHGDFAAIDDENLWFILGRSDDTIKIAGKRLGPAEVEAILNSHPAVTESAAIGVPHPIKDQEVIGFCVLREGYKPDEKVRSELHELVATGLGKALKPKEVRFVKALPKTRNAKVMHRIIRAAYLQEAMGDLSGLEDPGAVNAIQNSI